MRNHHTSRSIPYGSAAAQYRTEPWLSVARRHRSLPDNDECIICRRRDQLRVHHRCYRTDRLPYPLCIGRTEEPGDLLTLCCAHHNELHAWHDALRLDGAQLSRLSFAAQRSIQKLRDAVGSTDLTAFTDWYVMRGVFMFWERIGAFDATDATEVRSWTLDECVERGEDYVRIVNEELARRGRPGTSSE